MFKKAVVLTRPTPARRDAPFRGRPQRRGEEVHTKLRLIRSLRSHASGQVLRLQCFLMVEPLNEARTPLKDFFNIL
jgi:hypothetical protein